MNYQNAKRSKEKQLSESCWIAANCVLCQSKAQKIEGYPWAARNFDRKAQYPLEGSLAPHFEVQARRYVPTISRKQAMTDYYQQQLVQLQINSEMTN